MHVAWCWCAWGISRGVQTQCIESSCNGCLSIAKVRMCGLSETLGLGNHGYDALSRTFQTLKPETILKAIPVTMPMTHLVSVSGKKMEGVAKYPLDAWIDSGAPEFTNEKWAMICILIAERGIGATQSHGFSIEDKEVFEKLFATASKLKESGDYR